VPPEGPQSDRTAWRADPFLLAALALAFALRAGALALYWDMEGRGDERFHYVLGVVLTRLGSDAITRWAPGYEYFQAFAYALLGPEPGAVKALQVLVSTATVGLIYALALRLGGRRPARIAAFAAALYPTLIAYSHYLYTETLYLFLLTASIYAFFRNPDEPARRDLVASGVLFGLAALTRSVAVHFVPVWIGWCLLRGRRRQARNVAIMAGIALLVIAPWTLRNARLYERFVLVDPIAGLVGYYAFNLQPLNRDLGFRQKFESDREFCPPRPRLVRRDPLPTVDELVALFPTAGYRFLADPGRLRHTVLAMHIEASVNLADVATCERRNGIAYLREHPMQVLGMLPERVYGFLGPNSFLLRSVYNGVYSGGPLQRSAYPAVKAAVVVTTMAVFGLAILAFGRPGVPPIAEWFALFSAYYVTLHAVATAFSRYRLPLVPFAIALGAWWLARPRAPVGRARTPLVLGMLLGYTALCLHYLVSTLP
jgi:hypothetical protein